MVWRSSGSLTVTTVKIGYKLSSEEHRPNALVRYAQLAEQSGFAFALISDHYHPWIDRQGQSPFVWNVIGAIAHTTTRLQVGTAVTCPTVRLHPAIVAHAAATAAAMMEGRFFLGVGSGENLNEHILGDHWPPTAVRQQMLEEAVAVIRLLWEGGVKQHHGQYYRLENARIYTLPTTVPPVLIAAGGKRAASLAGRIGDGLIGTSPKRELIDKFEDAGGRGKPSYGELTVCWAPDEAQARRIARDVWPIAALESPLLWELPLPAHFEAATSFLTEDHVAESIVCGPNPARHADAIGRYVSAGFDHVCIHQVGHEQEGFLRFYQREVLPRLSDVAAA
jgi:coenzyme F420-dependent glucose-6-phosphate dehydrogenase